MDHPGKTPQPLCPPPGSTPLSKTRETANQLATAAVQSDGLRMATIPSNSTIGKRNQSTSSINTSLNSKKGTGKKKKEKKSKTVIKTNTNSDDTQRFTDTTRGLDMDGFTAVSIPSLTSGPQTLIPCSSANEGCKEVSTEPLLEDIHTRASHGESPTLQSQQRVQQPNHTTQTYPVQPTTMPSNVADLPGNQSLVDHLRSLPPSNHQQSVFHLLPQSHQLGSQVPHQPHLPSTLPGWFQAASPSPSSHPKCNSDTKLKSGLDRSVAPSATIYVLWPHEAFDRYSGRKDFKHYEDLSVGALAAGMVRALMYLPDFASTPTNIQMQLQNMSILFHSIVATNNLKSALEFQKSILLMLERGQLQWQPQFAPLLQSMQINYLASIRQVPTMTTSSSNVKPESQSRKSKDPEMGKRWKEIENTFCSPYQDGKCSLPAGHDKKKHFCKFCFAMRKSKLTHIPSQCPHNPISAGQSALNPSTGSISPSP